MHDRSRGVTVSTLDPESSDRGSNPREAFHRMRRLRLEARLEHAPHWQTSLAVGNVLAPSLRSEWSRRLLGVPDGHAGQTSLSLQPPDELQ